MSDVRTGLWYFALRAGPDDVAAKLSDAGDAAFERVEGDSTGSVLFRAHDGDARLELQNVAEWPEGTVYRLVAVAEDDGPDDLDERLRKLARAAGSACLWSHADYRARQRARAPETG